MATVAVVVVLAWVLFKEEVKQSSSGFVGLQIETPFSPLTETRNSDQPNKYGNAGLINNARPKETKKRATTRQQQCPTNGAQIRHLFNIHDSAVSSLCGTLFPHVSTIALQHRAHTNNPTAVVIRTRTPTTKTIGS